eukprot:scaffold30005_cov66-Phaeocystis_antarctica.AAC.7
MSDSRPSADALTEAGPTPSITHAPHSSCGGSTAAFHPHGVPSERTGRPALSQRAVAAMASGRPDEEHPAEVAVAFTCRSPPADLMFAAATRPVVQDGPATAASPATAAVRIGGCPFSRCPPRRAAPRESRRPPASSRGGTWRAGPSGPPPG